MIIEPIQPAQPVVWQQYTKKVLAWSLLLGAVWPLQYMIVAPSVTVLRFIGNLFKVVGVAIFLIFVPFLGWIVLYFVWQGRINERQAERRHREMMAALAPHAVLTDHVPKSVWYPWLLELVVTQP